MEGENKYKETRKTWWHKISRLLIFGLVDTKQLYIFMVYNVIFLYMYTRLKCHEREIFLRAAVSVCQGSPNKV